MSYRQRLRLRRTMGLLIASLAILACSEMIADAARAESPSAAQIQQVVADYFAKQPDYQPGDLITREDADAVVNAMSKRGWQVPKSQELLKNVLSADDALIRLFSTKDGQRLMRKVSTDKLVYDRLDRIARVAGGERMIQDLAKLPNAERYVKMPPEQGVPDLLDLLPKQRSGRKRSIKDYKKPTGRIYTAEDLAACIHHNFSANDTASQTRS